MKHANMYFVDSPLSLVELIIGAQQYGVLRGDMIICKWEAGYRSAGMYYFDGTKLIDQERSYDDNGAVPDQFKIITEFAPGYFDLPDRDVDAMRGFKAKVFTYYKGKYQFIAASREDLATVYWHCDGGSVSKLTLGPTTQVKYISVEKFDYHDTEEYVAILEYDGKQYILLGTSFDMNTTADYYVSTAINGSNGLIHVSSDTMGYLRTYGVPDDRILILSC